ncbi:MAG: hypothetical protein ABEJ31_13285 [Haloarculaceae archaeon]
MADTDADREEGVNFTDLDPVLEDLSYPISTAEFVAQHGGHTIERTNADPITVEDVFEGTGEDTYEDPEELRQAILTFMPADSVGRDHYSDRGDSAPEDVSERNEFNQDESF